MSLQNYVTGLESKNRKLGVVAHTSNPSTQEAEAGELQVGGQLRLGETLSPKDQNKQTKKPP
jgi:hypothetical protein